VTTLESVYLVMIIVIGAETGDTTSTATRTGFIGRPKFASKVK
jgi:hypothetical protein